MPPSFIISPLLCVSLFLCFSFPFPSLLPLSFLLSCFSGGNGHCSVLFSAVMPPSFILSPLPFLSLLLHSPSGWLALFFSVPVPPSFLSPSFRLRGGHCAALFLSLLSFVPYTSFPIGGQAPGVLSFLKDPPPAKQAPRWLN